LFVFKYETTRRNPETLVQDKYAFKSNVSKTENTPWGYLLPVTLLSTKALFGLLKGVSVKYSLEQRSRQFFWILRGSFAAMLRSL